MRGSHAKKPEVLALQAFVDALRNFEGKEPLYKKKPDTERFVKMVYGSKGYDQDGNRRVRV